MNNNDEMNVSLSHADEQEEQPTRMMFALSTIDNPFNPFDEFIDWFMYDTEHEYNCCSYLDRISQETDEMSELEKIKETERAIDEIIALNPNPIYIKVAKEVQL